MAKTTKDSNDFSFKLKDVDTLKKGYTTTSQLKKQQEELEKSLGDIVLGIQQSKQDLKNLALTKEEIAARKQQIKDNKEYRELLLKEHERLRKEEWNRSIAGKTTNAVKESISPEFKKDAANYGLASAFGPVGLMAHQLGLTKLGGKALGWGWNQLKNQYTLHKAKNSSLNSINSALTSEQEGGELGENSGAFSKRIGSGAGLWNKEEKRQEPIKRIDTNVEKILKYLGGSKEQKKKEKEKAEESGSSGGGFWESLGGSLLGNALGGGGWKNKLLKLGLGAGGAVLLNNWIKDQLPDNLKKHSEGATTGAMIGAEKLRRQGADLNYKDSYRKSLKKIRAKNISNIAKTGEGTSKFAKSVSKTAAKMQARGIKAASSLSKGMKGVPLVGAIVGTGLDVYQGYNEYQDAAARGDKIGKQKAVAATGGRVAGGVGGALAGAKAGALLGSFLGPIGTIAGGLLGAAVGGLAGSWLGDKAGRGGVDAYHAVVDTEEEHEANYPTSKDGPIEVVAQHDEERIDVLRKILGSLNELNHSLSPENQRYLDQEYIQDMKKLSPAPMAGYNNNMWDNSINMTNPMVG